MSEYRLTQEIVSRSVAKIWEQAKLEWELEDVYEAEEPDTCLCSHYPIIEICILRNRRNRNTALVGNCCVKKFIGLPSDKIFEVLKRIRKDEERSLNAETIQHAFDRGWITEWERVFSFNTMRKRSLSPKQMAVRIKINRTVIKRLVSSRPKPSPVSQVL